jgi:ethanolamine utilization protein EutQ
VDGVTHYTTDDISAWYQARGVEMAIGDVVDETNGDSMSVGFARYAKGAENEWTVTYDEALVITKGRFTVDSSHGPRTAGAGEVIFLPRGTRVVYRAEEDAELVYVTHPHWFKATRESDLAHQLEEYDEISAGRADSVSFASDL